MCLTVVVNSISPDEKGEDREVSINQDWFSLNEKQLMKGSLLR